MQKGNKGISKGTGGTDHSRGIPKAEEYGMKQWRGGRGKSAISYDVAAVEIFKCCRFIKCLKSQKQLADVGQKASKFLHSLSRPWPKTSFSSSTYCDSCSRWWAITYAVPLHRAKTWRNEVNKFSSWKAVHRLRTLQAAEHEGACALCSTEPASYPETSARSSSALVPVLVQQVNTEAESTKLVPQGTQVVLALQHAQHDCDYFFLGLINVII